MGGKSKKQTVGYKYYLGMHQVLCHGPIDNISRITVDDRNAWLGISTGGSITVNSPSLFGGDGREGGVSGTIDILMGAPDQGQNAYLVGQLGDSIPAYRGVVSAVFRQCYLGNNPYLKPWRFRGQRIYKRQNDLAQWYPSRAAIGTLTGKHAILIALDCSGSMDEAVAPGITRLDNAKASLMGVMDYIATYAGNAQIDIQVVAWAASVSSILRRNVTVSDIAAIKSFINSRTASGGTNFNNAVSTASSFYSGSAVDARRSYIFITDGVPDPGTAPTAAATLFAIPGVSSYAYNIDLADITSTLLMDNTPVDGVPVVVGADSTSLASGILSILGNALDMNPAHMIRECLTDPDWGMGYLDADMDDTTFQASANRLVSEGLGMSLLWDRSITIDAFIQEVVKHIDATLYVSRTSGKFCLDLIRGGYDINSLPLFDESNIARIEDPTRASFGELTNSVTVNYWDAVTGKDASLTVTDTALVQVQGAVINVPVQYPGFTNARNATVAGQRDLRTLSAPLLSCVIYSNSDGKDLKVGGLIRLSWKKWQLVNVPMRITGIAIGNGRSNQVKISCVQDVFNTSTTVVISTPPHDWQDPSGPPGAPVFQLTTEAPYYELAQVLGQATIDSNLASKPDIGYVVGATARAPSAINARMWTDDGTGYEDSGTVDFSPYGKLAADIGRMDTTFTLSAMDDMSEVTIGTHFQVGEELMRIDSINTGTGVVTVGRGVLDTVPVDHTADTPVLFWDQYYGFDPTEYVPGEEINVKITPASGAGVLPLDQTPEMTTEIVARAIRPYPPGDFKINGDYWPDDTFSGSVPISWVNRNRVQQTSGMLLDFLSGDITPEPGTTYTIRAVNTTTNVVIFEETGLTASPYSLDVSSLGVSEARVELTAVRDGFESYQPQWAIINIAVPAAEFIFDGTPYTAPPGNNVIIEFED